jgi:hypothetical protein
MRFCDTGFSRLPRYNPPGIPADDRMPGNRAARQENNFPALTLFRTRIVVIRKGLFIPKNNHVI